MFQDKFREKSVFFSLFIVTEGEGKMTVQIMISGSESEESLKRMRHRRNAC